MSELLQGIMVHGPWAAFALFMFIVYSRLVNDLLAVVRQNAQAFTASEKAIEQMTEVIIEVKDAMHKCRKVDA